MATRLAVLAGVVASVALAACSSHDGPTPRKTSQAEAICAGSLGAASVSAAETSVGEIRGLTIGPGQRPAKDAFPGVSDSTPGAWCWTGGPTDFVSYGVAATGQRIVLANVGGMSGIPSGPPVIP